MICAPVFYLFQFFMEKICDPVPYLILEKLDICMVCTIQCQQSNITVFFLQKSVSSFRLNIRNDLIAVAMDDQKWRCILRNLGNRTALVCLFFI